MLYILTLTWNGCDKLTKLKNSIDIALKDFNQDYLWLIKDNASTDNTIETTSSWNDKIKVIQYKDNLQNFSQGCNLLFNEASPQDDDYIMLLNNDVIFNDSSSINNMIKIMDSDKQVGVVGARLLYTDTDKLQHAGVVFDIRNKAPMHFRLGETTDNNAMKDRQFQVVTGAVLLTKAKYYKAAFNNAKSGNLGLDENYHWGFDDVDFCLSIKYNLEKKIIYCGRTNIFHEDSASLKKVPTNRLFLTHNLNYLRTKWINRYCFDKDMYEKDPKFNIYNR